MATLVDAAPDAIQLSPGQAPLLQRIPGPKPALVLRTDVANVYGPEHPGPLFSELIDRRGRAGASTRCRLRRRQPARASRRARAAARQCIRNVTALRAACDPVGMPLMVEPLVFKPGERGYGSNGDPERIVPLVRQAVELGADVIKADPTDDLADYGRVIETAAPRPLLVRGGGRATDEEILERTVR